MAVSTENLSRSEQSDDLAASATEGMLGPNPFVGLRPCDVLATAQQIGAQALRQPALSVEQEAKLARELMAVLSGNGKARRRRETSASPTRRGRTIRCIA